MCELLKISEYVSKNFPHLEDLDHKTKVLELYGDKNFAPLYPIESVNTYKEYSNPHDSNSGW